MRTQFTTQKTAEIPIDGKIPIASLKSGIDLRDEHIRDADKYPEITFDTSEVNSGKPDIMIHKIGHYQKSIELIHLI